MGIKWHTFGLWQQCIYFPRFACQYLFAKVPSSEEHLRAFCGHLTCIKVPPMGYNCSWCWHWFLSIFLATCIASGAYRKWIGNWKTASQNKIAKGISRGFHSPRFPFVVNSNVLCMLKKFFLVILTVTQVTMQLCRRQQLIRVHFLSFNVVVFKMAEAEHFGKRNQTKHAYEPKPYIKY